MLMLAKRDVERWMLADPTFCCLQVSCGNKCCHHCSLSLLADDTCTSQEVDHGS
jgi:hypothetical protein